ncbi:MAG: hypothetical protein C0631_18700 [Sedimenticola sp.]|nr:MAG: hypothetical protein C0631_18700 [Sedimenticola sp.]
MIEVSTLWLMILVELLLLTTVVSVLFFIKALRNKRKDRMAAQSLVESIKKDDPRRLLETQNILTSRFGLSADAAEAAAKKISREERLFYQTFMKIYLNRDTLTLPNLNVDFEAAVAPYRSLELESGSQPVGSGDSVAQGDQSEELQRLHDENERLSEELGITMETMARMLNEYSAMFAVDSVQTTAEPEAAKQPEPVVDEAKAETDESAVDPLDSDQEILLDDVIPEETSPPVSELDETLVADLDTDIHAEEPGGDDLAQMADDLDADLAALDEEFGDALDFDENDLK